jgi:deoxyribodipyrimidine photolyase
MQGLYDRARNALVTQLRGKTPTLNESEVNRERQLLDDAIRKVETEVNGKPHATAVHPTLVVKEQPSKHAVFSAYATFVREVQASCIQQQSHQGGINDHQIDILPRRDIGQADHSWSGTWLDIVSEVTASKTTASEMT